MPAATALLDAGTDPNTGFDSPEHQPEPAFEPVLYGAAGVAHHPGLTRLLLEHGADPALAAPRWEGRSAVEVARDTSRGDALALFGAG